MSNSWRVRKSLTLDIRPNNSVIILWDLFLMSSNKSRLNMSSFFTNKIWFVWWWYSFHYSFSQNSNQKNHFPSDLLLMDLFSKMLSIDYVHNKHKWWQYYKLKCKHAQRSHCKWLLIQPRCEAVRLFCFRSANHHSHKSS